MTLLAERPAVFDEGPAHEHPAGPSGFFKWITSTDHKVIGKNYTVTALIFFLMAGAMALLIRAAAGEPRTARCCRSTPTTRCSPCTAA